MSTWTSRTLPNSNAYYNIIYVDKFVAAGVGGNNIITSPDGTTWTARTVPTDANTLYSISYGNDQSGIGIYVAVGAGVSKVITSRDGITWTTRTTPGTNSWWSIAYGNGTFVAGAYAPTADSIMTSPDGINWSIQSISITTTWNDIVYANNLFIAVSGPYIMTSPTGVTWTQRTSPNSSLYTIAYGNGTFVALGINTTGNKAITSTDGITWTSRATPSNDNAWTNITYVNGFFVAVAYASTSSTTRAMTSPDGITWTMRTTPTNDWRGITSGNNRLVAIGTTNAIAMTAPVLTYGNLLVNSIFNRTTEDVSFNLNATTNNNQTSIVYTSANTNVVTVNSSGIVTIGNIGNTSINLYQPETATYWDASINTVINIFSRITSNIIVASSFNDIYGDPRFNLNARTNNTEAPIQYTSGNVAVATVDASGVVTVGNVGNTTIQLYQPKTDIYSTITANTTVNVAKQTTSISMPNLTWNLSATPDNFSWGSVAYGNGVFVAVASNGSEYGVMTSPDGIIWTRRTPANNNSWSSITYGNGLFAAVSTGSPPNFFAMTSPDGITWTNRALSLGYNYITYGYDLCGNGLFIAIAVTGRIVISYDGITWTTRATVPNFTWRSLTYGKDLSGNGLFVVVATSGGINNVMTTYNAGVTWDLRSSTIDVSGTQFYGIAYGNGRFVAVGSGGPSAGKRIMTSPDGINWTVPSYPTTSNIGFIDIIFANNLFVAVGNSGSPAARIMTSPDGINWTEVITPTNFACKGLAYGNNTYVVVSDGTITGYRAITASAIPTFNKRVIDSSFNLLASTNNTQTPIVYTSGNTSVATVNSSGNVSIIGLGNTSITLAQPTTSNYSIASTSAFINITTKTYPLITCATIINKRIVGSSFNLSATTTNSETAIQYTSGNVTVATVDSSGNVIIGNLGTTTIQLYQPETTNYSTITANTIVNVSEALRPIITVASRFNETYGDAKFNLIASTTNIETNIQYTSGNTSIATVDASGVVTVGNAGTTTIQLYQPQTENYSTITTNTTVNVAKQTTSISMPNLTWNLSATPDDLNWVAVAYGNGLFVAIAYYSSGNGVMTSPDGIRWTRRTPVNNNYWVGLTYGNGLFVAVAEGGTVANNRLMTSPDGINWTPRAVAPLNNVKYGYDLCGNGLFVATNASGNRAASSYDGITWTIRTPASNISWRNLTYGKDLSGNGLFVAIAANGGINNIMTTYNGITWTLRSSPIDVSGTSLYGIAYGNGRFVAVGGGNTVSKRIITSPDGINWTVPSYPTTSSIGFYSIIFENNLFVAVGLSGSPARTMTSPDGINWTEVNSPTNFVCYGIAYGNNTYVVVGDGNLPGYRAMTASAIPTFNKRVIDSSFNLLASTNNTQTPIVYTSGNTSVATVNSSGNVSIIGLGRTNITLSQPTTSNYSIASTSASINITTKTYPLITCATIINKRIGDPSFNLTATTTNSETAIQYTSGNVTVATVNSSGVVTIGNLGTTTIQLYQPETTNYSTITANTIVNVSIPDITVASSFNKIYGDVKFNLIATTTNNETPIQYTSGNTSIATVDASGVVTVGNVGNTTIQLYQPQTANYFNVTANTAINVAKQTASISMPNLTWNLSATPADLSWLGVAYGNGLFVAVAYNGSGNAVMTSPDGITWSSRTTANDSSWNGITYGNGLFVAVAINGPDTNRLMTSPDGIIWTRRAVTSLTNVIYGYDLCGNGLFVALNIAGNRTATSYDGISWTIRTAAANISWRNLTYGKDLSGNGLFVAIASNGGINNVMTTYNGIDWTLRSSTIDVSGTNFYGIAYGNGRFVAVGFNGPGAAYRIMTSPDGINWTVPSYPTSNNIDFYSIIFANNLFVAVGDSTTTSRSITSPDGINWTVVNSPTNFQCRGIAYGNNTYVVVGDGALAGYRAMTASAIPIFNKTYGDASFNLLAAANNNETSIVYTSGNVSVANVDSSGNVSIIGAGNTSITLAQSTTTNYSIVSTSATINVSRLTPTITIDSSFNKAYGDPSFNLAATTTNNETAIQYTSGNVTVATVDASGNVIIGNIGNTTIQLYQPETANYSTITANTLMNVSKRTPNITIDSSFNKTYGDPRFNINVRTTNNETPIQYTSGNVSVATVDASGNVTIGNVGNTTIQLYQPETANYFTITANTDINVAKQTASISMPNLTWNLSATPADLTWRSVVYGNGVFVAVAVNGSGNGVMTSPDGITWTSRTPANDNSWNWVTYGNGIFAAVANGGAATSNYIMTSPDGITWSPRTASGTTNSITYGYDLCGNGFFIALHTGNRVYTSYNGIVWTLRTPGYSNSWRSITYGKDLSGNGLFAAVASTGGINNVMTSYNGIAWTLQSSTVDVSGTFFTGLVYGNGKFVAVGFGGPGAAYRIMTSPDGINWTVPSYPTSSGIGFANIIFANNLFVAVGFSGTTARTMTSPDGINWTVVNSPTNFQCRGIAYANNTYVVVGDGTIAGYRAMTASIIPIFTKTSGDASFNLLASANNNETSIVYTSGNVSVATVDTSGNVSIIGGGNTSITLSQPTTSNYSIVSTSATINVAKLSSNITVGTSFNKTYRDPSFNLAATTTNNETAIQYTSGNITVATVNSSGVVTIGNVGNTTIQLYQPDTANYSTITANTTVDVSRLNANIRVASRFNKIYGDPSFNLNATTTNNETAIQYTSGNVDVVTIDSSGIVTIGNIGNTTIQLYQPETANYFTITANTSVNVLLTSIQTTPIITVDSSFNKTYGDPSFNISATTDNFETPIIYVSGNTSIASVDTSGNVSIVGAGNTTITLSQIETENYLPVSANTLINIAKSPPVISIDSSFNKTYGDSSFSLSATTTNNETSIIYVSGNVSVATVDTSGIVSIVDIGNTTIQLSQIETANYLPVSANTNVIVSKIQANISVLSAFRKIYGNYTFNINATSNNSQTPIEYTSGNTNVATVDTSGNVSIVGLGTTTITLSQTSNTYYFETSTTTTVYVTNQSFALEWNGSVFILAVHNDTSDIGSYLYSYDGLSWTSSEDLSNSSILVNKNPYNVKWTGTNYALMGNLTTSGGNTILRSTNGIHYSALSTNTTTPMFDLETNLEFPHTITFPRNITLALGGVTADSVKIAFSTDEGITWTPSSNSATVFNKSANNAVWNGKLWVAVGATGNTLATSTNGNAWVGRGSYIFTTEGFGIAWSNEQAQFIAAGSGTNALAYSYDGVYWLGLGTGMLSIAYDVQWNGSIWVATGTPSSNNKSIAYSYDGRTWANPTQTDLFDIAGKKLSWNGSFWVVVGSSTSSNSYKNIGISNDGVIWKMMYNTSFIDMSLNNIYSNNDIILITTSTKRVYATRENELQSVTPI